MKNCNSTLSKRDEDDLVASTKELIWCIVGDTNATFVAKRNSLISEQLFQLSRLGLELVIASKSAESS